VRLGAVGAGLAWSVAVLRIVDARLRLSSLVRFGASMLSYNDLEPNRVKHLELLQAVISRLGNDSFLVKGWAVTVAGAFVGVALSSEKWQLALASLITTFCFWGLDTYFLRTERLFRALYDHVAGENVAVAPFFMSATGPRFIEIVKVGESKDVVSWWKTAQRPTLSIFYGVLTLSAVVVSLLIGQTHGSDHVDQSEQRDRHHQMRYEELGRQTFRTASASSPSSFGATYPLGGQIRPKLSASHRGTT
jgi:hypothetical protein